MTTRYPQSFYHQTKRVLAGDPPTSPLPSDCENCGGRGFLTAFLVDAGPFMHTPATADGKKGQPRQATITVDDPQYGWVWYTGNHMVDTCPVCGGTGRKMKPKPATRNITIPERRLNGREWSQYPGDKDDD